MVNEQEVGVWDRPKNHFPHSVEDILDTESGDTEELKTTLNAFRRLWIAALPWHRPRILKAALEELLKQHRQLLREWTEFFAALDDRFKKVYKDKASTAVEGMTDTPVSREVATLESKYKALSQSNDGKPERIVLAMQMVRQQVAVLALAHERRLSELQASQTQSEHYAEFLRSMGQPRELAIFLKEQFPNTWAEQSEKGVQFTKIAQHIMLSLKEGRAVN
jgi:hypothetical protein